MIETQIAKTPSPPAEAGAGSGAAWSAPWPTLLVVDDDEATLAALRVIFADRYRVLTAADGYAAIRLAQQQPFDAAVVDLCMPGLSGMDVIGRLKEIDPTISVVILTGHQSLETAREALRLGAVDYLSKPFEVARIRGVAAEAVERHQQLRRARDLETALIQQQAAVAAARSQNEIYAGVLHDMNTPLTSISALTELLADDLEQVSLGRIRESLNVLRRQADHCVAISQRYLRLLSGAKERGVRTSVNQALEDLEQLLRVHAQARDNEVIIHRLPVEPICPVNGFDLVQMLLNLAVNAVQATSVRHRIEVLPQVRAATAQFGRLENTANDLWLVSDRFDRQAPLLQLTVSDDGPGMKPEVLARIFQPFFSTKQPGQGTGIGLSVVRALVFNHGGAVHAHSEPGIGTAFDLFFPLTGWRSG